jgi:hypothetical protein
VEDGEMKLSAKAQDVAEEMLRAFETGQVPKAMAQVFIRHEYSCPAQKWSWANRLMVALRGHFDARGYRQWKAAGRQVKKGERACHILAPRTKRVQEDDEARGLKEGDTMVVGFVTVAVFGLDQTEGEPLPHLESEAPFLDSLPMVEVARSWGLEVSTFDARGGNKLGFYRYGERIGVGVRNLSTWAHELVHAADDRLGTLTRQPGQQLDNEVVAELGGAILLECLGFTEESDRGGAFVYLRQYAEKHERKVISVCTELLERTCSCIELLLETAAEQRAAGVDKVVAA